MWYIPLAIVAAVVGIMVGKRGRYVQASDNDAIQAKLRSLSKLEPMWGWAVFKRTYGQPVTFYKAASRLEGDEVHKFFADLPLDGKTEWLLYQRNGQTDGGLFERSARGDQP